jgi:hypothetical protein
MNIISILVIYHDLKYLPYNYHNYKCSMYRPNINL